MSFWVKIIELESNAECKLEIVDGTTYSPERVISVTSSSPKNEWIKYSTQFYGIETNS
jgi:hypothetical protein